MYIEGNALILGDSSYLEHHGILGQKWGVRRFQNKDGTRTAAGKARDQKNAAKIVALSTRRTRNSWQYQNAVTKAQDKLTNDSKSTVRKMAADALYGERKAEYKAAVEEYDAATNYRYDEYRKEADKYEAIAGMACGQRYPTLDPAKFDQDTRLKWDAEFYMYDDGDQGKYNSYDYFLVAKGENPNKVFDRAMKARNNIEGIAKKDADDILGDSKDQVIKGKVKDRTVADELAYQITEMATSLSDYTMVWEHQSTYTDDEIKQMKEDIKKYSKEAARLGLTHSAMFIEDGTLYLSHHGIRGQRWGVRRFQNRDGSLTNAGRKRLGYATKGVTQTVGKAFKAGVKAGGNAVKAVKAHHEKKEAEKLQKKKEKASKTRLGVMANKDLFTNEEIRKLNERFKLEDEMKMATLQKGVEIAKAVGTIAQNVGTVAKTYEDVTGQSLSPIKRKAAEEKARQDKEDRERRIAREDAEEARKAAKEERDIAIHEQTLRKAIASADTQEFTAQKTKAEADSSILDLYKKGQDFNGGSDATGSSWMEKATSGGKNVFEQMKYDSDPEYRAAKDAHDEKVARKERMDELDRREKEREAEKAAANRPQQPQQKQGGGDDALFSQKGSLPIDKDRYRNNRAMEKAKRVKEDAAEERAKKQDEKAAKATIDDMMEARRKFTDSARANSNGAFDRETAANYIKGKAKELPSKLNPVNAIAKKITNKALKEEEDNARKAMEDEYKKTSRLQGRDEANYTMYYNRVNALQAQGYSERQAKKVADTESPFSSKRNRRFEYNEKLGEIETTHRKNAKEINKANKELTDYYYKLVNGPGYEPGTPKREALDRKYAQKRGELEKLEKDNNDMLDREKKKAKKILEHSFSIQNGVLFVDSSDSLAHHGVKGQRWGVRRFQNEDGSLTPKGRKHYEKAIAKIDRMQTHSDARRGRLERQHPFAVTGAAVLGAVAAGMSIAATGGASVAMITAGSAISAAVSAGLTHATYSVSEAWEGRGTKHRQKKRKEYEEMLNHDGLIISDGTLYLEHHGIKGQRWGVRRFQNPDGTRTDAGKKRDAKLAAKAEKKAAKIAAKDAKRSAKAEKIRAKAVERYERKAALSRRESEAEAYKLVARDTKKASQKELLSDQKVSTTIAVGQGILGAIGLATYGVPTVAAIAGGAAIVGIMRNYNLETVRTSKTLNNLKGAEKARLAKSRATDQIMDDWREEGLGVRHHAIKNGTLFIDAGDPYLEHHGVKGMKWGKHLMAGKGVDAEAGGGGGFAEDDEKLKEMAKKAGMSVAEYRTKMAGKLGGAASKVGSGVYDAAGGSHKKNAEGWRKMAQEESNAARVSEKSSHENSARAASQDRKYGSGGDAYRRAAESDKENAETHRSNAKARSERAASEQAAYEKSLAGKYDKMKADRARKKSAKEKKRLLTQTSAEAKRISVKDKHLVIDRSRSGGATSRALAKRYLPFDRENSAARPKDTRSFKQKAYDALGGKYKTQAAEAHKDMVYYKNKADDSARRANAQSRAVKDAKKKGAVQDYIANKEGARQLEEEAKGNRFAQWDSAKKANSAQWKYDHSIAGLYDKATGKYKQSHKKTKVPKLMDQAKYYYKEGSNNKLYNNGASKAKTAKDQAKAEVWKAADHVINSHDYYNQSYDPTVTAYGLDTAYRKEAVKYGRLAEGAYRRAAALGKQASRETSTSSRPRARKKKHTSGGSGVTVRRPGRKPVSRTKRVTQSSTGVKRRGATGTGARVRRGA